MRDLGIFAWFGYQVPLDERLGLIAEAGFDSTCLWLGEDEDLVARGAADRMPVLAREAGLAVDNAHAPFERCNLLWSDSKTDVETIGQEYRSALSFCDRHDIRNLVIHISMGSTLPVVSDMGMDRLRELTAYAEDKNLVIAIENTRRLDYLDTVFSSIESPHLGLCYDSSHDAVYSQRPGHILEAWGHRLVTTHLSDNYGKMDDHFLPGNGTIDWAKIVKSFPRQTYKGPIMLEAVPKDPRALNPTAFLHAAFTEAVRLGQMLG
jgi:sugar phosphate isomerase/epimerase